MSTSALLRGIFCVVAGIAMMMGYSLYRQAHPGPSLQARIAADVTERLKNSRYKDRPVHSIETAVSEVRPNHYGTVTLVKFKDVSAPKGIATVGEGVYCPIDGGVEFTDSAIKHCSVEPVRYTD